MPLAPIQYQLRRTDQLAWILGYMLRNPFVWAFVFLLTAFRCWTLFRDGLAQSIPLLTLHATVTSTGLWLAYAACVALFTALRPAPALGLEVTLEIGPESIRSGSTLGSQELRWQAFQKVRRSAAHTFLCLSPSQALIIPDRAFPDPQHREAFIAECRSRVAAARGAA